MIKLSKKEKGIPEQVNYLDGVEICTGGACGYAVVTPNKIQFKVRCHSCQHHNLSDYGISTCSALIKGFTIPIEDYRTTRCGLWQRKKSWVDAIMGTNKGPLKIMTPQSILKTIQKQNSEVDRLREQSKQS